MDPINSTNYITQIKLCLVIAILKSLTFLRNGKQLRIIELFLMISLNIKQQIFDVIFLIFDVKST